MNVELFAPFGLRGTNYAPHISANIGCRMAEGVVVLFYDLASHTPDFKSETIQRPTFENPYQFFVTPKYKHII